MAVDVVLIGRNEGERLVASLSTVRPQARRIVYVDSGSTDNSVANAEAVGATVIELDMSVPFTAARARNAGATALVRQPSPPDLIMFLDGDCLMSSGWLEAAEMKIRSEPKIGLVTGLQREIHPNASVYNKMFDMEWNRPTGEIEACAGNMLIRTSAFNEVDGFNPNVIAAEDDELCVRMRKAGWTLWRIDQDMARHDADMHHFRQWWKRAERTGHGFAQVGHLHPEYFKKERLRGWFYGLLMPLLLFVGFFAFWPLVLLVFLLFGLSWFKTAHDLQANGTPQNEARHQAVFLMLSKFPNVIGMLRFHWRRLVGGQMKLIEYK